MSPVDCWPPSRPAPPAPFPQFYEVDSRPALQRKKQLLDEVLLGWRHAALRPRFAEGGSCCRQREPYAVQLRGARICALGLPRSTCTLPTSCACSNLPLAVDFGSDSSLKLLLTELTGAGFDPSERCCVVAEGLLPFLSQVGGWAHRLACKTNVDSCARAGTSAGCWDATLIAASHCALLSARCRSRRSTSVP